MVKSTQSSWRYPSILSKNHFFFQFYYHPVSPLSALNTLVSTELPSSNSSQHYILLINLYTLISLLLKIIFSVQNSNFMYSVEFSFDRVQIQIRETISEIHLARMYIPIQVWHRWSWCKEILRNIIWRKFASQRNILEACKWAIVWACGNELPRDCWFYMCGSTIRVFIFPREEGGFVENSITIKEEEGFTEPKFKSANQQDNHRRTCWALHWELAKNWKLSCSIW